MQGSQISKVHVIFFKNIYEVAENANQCVVHLLFFQSTSVQIRKRTCLVIYSENSSDNLNYIILLTTSYYA